MSRCAAGVYLSSSSQVLGWSVAPKMRRLSRKKALNLVKELDAFPKVPESYVETTASGGTGECFTSFISSTGSPKPGPAPAPGAQVGVLEQGKH